MRSARPVQACGEMAEMDAGGSNQLVTLARSGFTRTNLKWLRDLVRWAGQAVGLDRQRRHRLVLAANEAAPNAIRHAGGRGEVQLLRDDERRLIAEITDHGPGLPSGVTVRRPPVGAFAGRGLWLIHESSDRVAVHTGSTGTTVRIEMMIPGSGQSSM